jgi:hypothetical protein
MSIGYLDVQVPKEKLKKLKSEMDKAPTSQKYGRYKAWLHYANLDMWQAQGHHFQYVTEVGLERKHLICTCGLYLVEGEELEDLVIEKSLAMRVGELLLDRLQTVKGHRSLDDFKTPTCALIVDYVWKSEIDDYLWAAYCQECGALVVEQRNELAKGFVDAHNKKCQVRHE